MERVLINQFQSMFKNSWMRKSGKNIFELCFQHEFGEEVTCPEVIVGTYTQNGHILPNVIIHGDSLSRDHGVGRLLISDQALNQVGSLLEMFFEYEYVKFLRLPLN
jgi:hypothetical protein